MDANSLARRKLDIGPDHSAVMDTVDSAQITAHNTLRVNIRHDDPNYGETNGLILSVVIEKENGHIRVMESKGSDGKEYVKDGIVTLNNQATPWMEKCEN